MDVEITLKIIEYRNSLIYKEAENIRCYVLNHLENPIFSEFELFRVYKFNDSYHLFVGHGKDYTGKIIPAFLKKYLPDSNIIKKVSENIVYFEYDKYPYLVLKDFMVFCLKYLKTPDYILNSDFYIKTDYIYTFKDEY